MAYSDFKMLEQIDQELGIVIVAVMNYILIFQQYH